MDQPYYILILKALTSARCQRDKVFPPRKPGPGRFPLPRICAKALGKFTSRRTTMKFTLSWLKDHLETTAALDEILYALTDLGLEVEAVVNPAARLAPFTLARVLHAEKHPDADKLRVCRVLTDEGEKQIVCGAPNARAGITVVLCKPGDHVPGIDVTLGVGKIRGVESHGMMASERELELSDEHNGIIELPSGEVGQKFVDWLAANRPGLVDPMIEIKITPNRPDALGVRGIARDLAARGLGRLKPLPIPAIKAGFPSPVQVEIHRDLKNRGCPHFAGRTLRGVKNTASPEWLQNRLKAIGLRPISALVDITNYFTFGLNRPLHVFDVAKVKGKLRIHPAQGGEEFLALDGKTYTLRPGPDGDFRRSRRGKPCRHHGRRTFGLHRGHHRCLSGKRLLGSDHHCHHRPGAEDQLRCPLPL